MDWKARYRQRLSGHLDSNGDLAPPWERFPEYERYTIGWRMGMGEGWLAYWHVFLEQLDPSPEIRLAYLRRHAPAPYNWASHVYSALHPESVKLSGKEIEKAAAQFKDEFIRMGLIASDVAYSTWLSQHPTVRWPWENVSTPEEAARHRTREFWFWSRQINEIRRDPSWNPPTVPQSWQACAGPLKSGEIHTLDHTKGLLLLAEMLSAGRVTPPWTLGLTLKDFADTFEADMRFVDAFRLWGMSIFDDGEHLQRYLASTDAPEVWCRWCAELFLWE